MGRAVRREPGPQVNRRRGRVANHCEVGGRRTGVVGCVRRCGVELISRAIGHGRRIRPVGSSNRRVTEEGRSVVNLDRGTRLGRATQNQRRVIRSRTAHQRPRHRTHIVRGCCEGNHRRRGVGRPHRRLGRTATAAAGRSSNTNCRHTGHNRPG